MKAHMIACLIVGSLFINSLQSQISFYDVTGSAGVAATMRSYGAAWGDYDNDGDLDLYVTKREGEPNHLYENPGTSGVWSDVASGKEVNDAVGSGHGVAFADYDNDGDLDIYIGNHGANVAGQPHGGPNLLYVNRGPDFSYKFFDDASPADVDDPTTHSAGIAWGDYNTDGYLDIYVGNHQYQLDTRNRLFRSNTGDTFEKVAQSAGVDTDKETVGVTWADYDNDGDLDLFVANRLGEDNDLFQNNGDGTFSTSFAIVGNSSNAGAFGDYDNDGDLDLYITTDGTISQLFQNDGAGGFNDVTGSAFVETAGATKGVVWADFDNDGWLDLYVSRCAANGNGSNMLFRNNGNETFTNKASEAGVDNTGCGSGVTAADYDNDGDLDIYLCNQETSDDNVLYRKTIRVTTIIGFMFILLGR